MTMNTLSATDIERLAHKRAGARMGLYVHATVYLLVNLGLWTIALLSGRHWAVFPTLGWGLGLAIHGLVTLLNLRGQGLRDLMAASEVQRLRQRR